MASSTACTKERFLLRRPYELWSWTRHLQQNLSRIWVCCSEFACLNQSVWWWWWLNWVYEWLSFSLSVHSKSLSLLAEMACNMRGSNYNFFRPESAFSDIVHVVQWDNDGTNLPKVFFCIADCNLAWLQIRIKHTLKNNNFNLWS
jgi:hypothetical protein